MIDLQSVLTYLTLISIPIGVIYHILTLRNTRKNQELTKKAQEQSAETRKIQLLWNFNQSLASRGSLNWMKVLGMEWNNYDDFMLKFGVDNNPELYEARMHVQTMLNFQGMLIRDGLIDVETLFNYNGDASILFWEKFKDIFVEQRRIFENPMYMIGVETLAVELNKYRVSQGWTAKTIKDILYSKSEP